MPEFACAATTLDADASVLQAAQRAQRLRRGVGMRCLRMPNLRRVPWRHAGESVLG